LHVLHDLADHGELRFNELKESTGASSRTLSQSLDALTEAALLRRRLEEAPPVATHHSLTRKGEDSNRCSPNSTPGSGSGTTEPMIASEAVGEGSRRIGPRPILPGIDANRTTPGWN